MRGKDQENETGGSGRQEERGAQDGWSGGRGIWGRRASVSDSGMRFHFLKKNTTSVTE